jgi:hypothetical protein
VRESRQSNTDQDVDEDDELGFLEFEEDIGAKFRSHRQQIVDLGSSSPTYSVTSESRKPPTTMKTRVAEEMPFYGNAPKFSIKNTPATTSFK